uniref:NADH-ubiquinone oxidoreductase chain 5 n=1 Tax=Hyocrinidae sp. TaxID=3078845 RepID=A0AA96MNC9_9ECHI|nr:NADH dehydrogenase subunit 5 [Hyocrinidae sp.]
MNLVFFLGSIVLSIFFFLLLSIFSFSENYSFFNGVKSFFGLYVDSSYYFYDFGRLSISCLKFLSFFSIICFYFYLGFGAPTIKLVFHDWLSGFGFLGSFCFILDFYTICFFFVGNFVTLSIIQFSYYYMLGDPRWSSFFRLLLIFLFNMLILVSSDNLFFIFIGWEGVGFLSFLLIGWWGTRLEANSSSLEAVIYNRIGDIGFLFFFSICLSFLNSWSLFDIYILCGSLNSNIVYSLLFSVLIAAIAKSAQFGFHPWLPAAMEGPTPVSALLHSSTMVVAGVFLLIRLGNVIDFPPLFCSVCLVLGGVTSFYAASVALVQHDIKKIVAYSTTSQLGLMIFSIGLGSFVVAFFHICTHAFFKAMLFLCSGSIIHSLNDEQDLRKMGGLFYFLPITSSCVFLGSLSLSGVPFLSGFYSKDLILEIGLLNISNLLGVFLAFLSSIFTVVYSFRIVIFCFLMPFNNISVSSMSEENKYLVVSIVRLALGTIFVGWFFCNYVFPEFIVILPNSFNANIFFMVVLSVFSSLSVYLSFISFSSFMFSYSFLSGQWFFFIFFHNFISRFYFFISIFKGVRLLDRGWVENVGPYGSGVLFSNSSSLSQFVYSGFIKYYILSSFLILFWLLILVILV